jgi:toxin ParE1/3/4
MSVRDDVRALADLGQLRAYIARRQPAAAERLGRRIAAAAELLLTYPDLGRVGRAPGTRELAVARTPYLLVYRHQGETVTTVRVLHGAQD